jgi:hypothetical protein
VIKGIDLLISELATICVVLELCTTASLAPQKDGCTKAVALLAKHATAAAAAAATFILRCIDKEELRYRAVRKQS